MTDPTKAHLTMEALARLAAAAEPRLRAPTPPPTLEDLAAFRTQLALDELAAPLDPSGPMPLTIQTLAYIPPALRGAYVRRKDGSFHLAFIEASDIASRDAYLERIAKGELDVMPDGETRAELAARIEANERQGRAVMEEVDRANADAAVARKQVALAALNRKHEAIRQEAIARIDAESAHGVSGGGTRVTIPDDIKCLTGLIP